MILLTLKNCESTAHQHIQVPVHTHFQPLFSMDETGIKSPLVTH